MSGLRSALRRCHPALRGFPRPPPVLGSRPGLKGCPGQGGRFGRRDVTRAGRRALLHGERGEVGFGRPERGARSWPHGPCSPQPLQQGCSWKRFSPFDKIVFSFLSNFSTFFFFNFSSENEPLKRVQGTTGEQCPDSPGTWRGDNCHLPCPCHHGLEPSPSFPQAPGAVSAALLLLPPGQPRRLCPTVGVTRCPVPSLSPRPSLVSPLQ